MKINKIILVYLLCLFTGKAFSQNSSIEGTIIDSLSNLPMEYVGVSIYSSADSNLTDGTVTDSTGFFKLTGLKEGKFYLKIDCIGYRSRMVPAMITGKKSKIAIGSVSLSPGSQLFKEVLVSGTRESVLNKIDKQVYKADTFESDKGGTAVDVWRNMPSVNVNAQGGISLRGSAEIGRAHV